MMRLVAASLAVLVTAASAHADVAFPDTPAAKEAQRYVQAYNTADAGQMASFLRRNYPGSPEKAGDVIDGRLFRGRIHLVSVNEASQSRFAGRVQYENFDTYRDFKVTIDPTDPRRIATLELKPLDDAAAPRVQRLDDKALSSAVRARMARLPDFSGVVLIARDGKIVFEAAQGFADRNARTANRTDTRFRVGSMDKMFTAVAVAQLAEAGKLDLDAPFGTYLKGYPNADLARSVTIRRLLNHTGGTGDIFGPEFDNHRLELKTVDDYVRLYGTRPADFPPGARWDYSNYGYVLLGRVIEAVSGHSFYDYVRDNILRPAGMTRTGFEPEMAPVPDRARPYVKDSKGVRGVESTLPFRGTSAGGGYSTAADFLAFATALEDGKLLSAQGVEMLTTGNVEAEGGVKYGYGFMDGLSNGLRVVGHSGGADGMNGDLEILGGGQGVVVVLSNVSSPPLAQGLSRFITARITIR